MEFNKLPDDYEGEQKRDTEFESIEAKLDNDAKGLIEIARAQLERTGVKTEPIVFARRKDDDMEALRSAIAKEQKTTITQAIDQKPRQLTPEKAAETLTVLESRFTSPEGLKRHKGIEWSRVKAALLASPEALWSVNGMETQGHEPDVYFADDGGFDVGTCSAETPTQGRNCVYDEEAAEWLRKNHPTVEFNGSAVAMAKELGIDLMDAKQYDKQLQKTGKYDKKTWSWLKTPNNIRRAGGALVGDRDGDVVYVSQSVAYAHYGAGSWRGSLRVNWAA